LQAISPRSIPTTDDRLDGKESYVTKAIIMHLFREGQLDVANTFLKEAWDQGTIPADDTFNEMFAPLESSFTELNRIIAEIKQHRNLTLAIDWAEQHSEHLRANASDLQFKLFKLQFIWLVKGPAVNGLADDEYNGPAGALKYAKSHVEHFRVQHDREIGRLLTSVAYLPNINSSPYRTLYQTDRAFDDVASAFARDFCCLLNLSADSPLYLAATAGAIAFPRRLKHMQLNLAQRTEWTTPDEQPFETPLPPSMVFHPIFVCPVAKEQTTAENPPMILPCGHVVSREALKKIVKGSSRFKCPYCPNEGVLKDAREIQF
jgi:E3 ubiquitin-protein transferase RMND5